MILSVRVLRTLAALLVLLAVSGSATTVSVLREYLMVNDEALRLGPTTPMPTVLSYVEMPSATFGRSTDHPARTPRGTSFFETTLDGASEPVVVRTGWLPTVGMAPPQRARGLYRPRDHRLELERGPRDARGYAIGTLVGFLLPLLCGVMALVVTRRPGGETADVSWTRTPGDSGAYRAPASPPEVRVRIGPSGPRQASFLLLHGVVALMLGAFLLLVGRTNTISHGEYVCLIPLSFVAIFAVISSRTLAPAALVSRPHGIEVSRFGSRVLVAAPWALEVQSRTYPRGGTVHSVGVRESAGSAKFRVVHHTPSQSDADALAVSVGKLLSDPTGGAA